MAGLSHLEKNLKSLLHPNGCYDSDTQSGHRPATVATERDSFRCPPLESECSLSSPLETELL